MNDQEKRWLLMLGYCSVMVFLLIAFTLCQACEEHASFTIESHNSDASMPITAGRGSIAIGHKANAPEDDEIVIGSGPNMLDFKSDGRIFLGGRLAANDLEVVNSLRTLLQAWAHGCRCAIGAPDGE